MGKVSRFSSLIFLIAFSCCAIPVEADPIRILAGSVTAEGSPPEALDGSGIKLSGDGLSIDESLEGQSGFVVLGSVPTVEAGLMVDLSGTFHHEEPVGEPIGGLIGGELAVLTPPVSLPFISSPTQLACTNHAFLGVVCSASAPFTLDADVTFTTTSGLVQRRRFLGSGTVRGTLTPGLARPGVEVQYIFEATPTPEPATLSLIVTSLFLAGVPALRHRRAARGPAALACAVLFLLVGSASADPIRVTSGQLTIPDDEPGGFEFFGPDGFALIGGGRGSQFIVSSPRDTCFQVECTSGTRLSLSAVLGGSSPLTPFTVGLGVANINGQHFFTQEKPGGFIGTFTFDAPTIILPPVEQVPNGVGFRVPFVFHGDVTAFAAEDLEGTTPLFHINLVGEGTLGIGFLPFGTRYGEVDSTYTFAATPEPASLVLTTTALLGLLSRRRMRLAPTRTRAERKERPWGKYPVSRLSSS